MILDKTLAAVCAAVGTREFLAAVRQARAGEVSVIERAPGSFEGYVWSGQETARAWATLTEDDGLGSFTGECTCARAGCGHPLAMLVAGLSGTTREVPATASLIPQWEELAVAIGEPETAGELSHDRVGLQFEVVPGQAEQPADRERTARPAREASVLLRPVLLNAKGRWVRQGVSWRAVASGGYETRGLPERPVALLRELLALAGRDLGHSAYLYRTQGESLPLAEIDSRRFWDLLAEARQLGMGLLQPQKGSGPVEVHAATIGVEIGIEETGDQRTGDQETGPAAGLQLRPRFALPPDLPELLGPTAGEYLVIGRPGHGLAWWGPGASGLQLARLDTPLDDGLRALFGTGPVEVPPGDRERFLEEYVPAIRRRVRLAAAPGLELPQPERPLLQLTAVHGPGNRLALDWAWTFRRGRGVRRVPLDPHPEESPGRPDPRRDPAAEAEILGPVRALTRPEQLVPGCVLTDMAVVRFLESTLPALQALDGVEVLLEVDDAAPRYAEAVEAPQITLTGGAEEGSRDWFDLAVSVRLGDVQVPFDALFRALAAGDEYLLLADGQYFSLDHPQLKRLAALIAEARAMHDAPEGSVRLSRFQAGLWGELEEIGVVAGQASQWLASVRRLQQVAEQPDLAPPPELQATLRPYQLSGFSWLARLYAYGLGGVLADDMGLGKTVQTLALFCHVRREEPEGGPFLVVAPTSVVGNWAAEAQRFAPHLRVVALTETRARRRSAFADEIAGADLVVTSYTIFRLDHEEYTHQRWSGLILDEAQLVKNHQGRGYKCARTLDVGFKLAITGTPMENNLMELWSLLSITAPGLFPSPDRFTSYYRTPIEKDRDVELLDQLRRRVRPLMLRRTKDLVAPELPEKQEQVLELELSAKHRTVYQRYLQRERQKVLGLLGDLDGNRFEIFRSLTLLRQAALDVRLVDPERHKDVPSTKLDVLMEQLSDIVAEGHRVLIFSQFTRFLQAARERLESAGVGYCYLDGSTRNRPTVIEEFRTGVAPVFLISLKAGGFGLNLTEADYCIMLDPWWNPATEAQAVDRVHRIGQTRTVMVYRMVAKGTIEEKVMALKAEKSALFSSVLDGGEFGSGSLSADDIRSLME